MIKPIKTALLSYGMSGAIFHAPLLMAMQGFSLEAVVERNIPKVTQRYPLVKSVRNHREIMEDDSIELVVVNTPNDTHFELAKVALLAGKHVIVEKPFTVSSREAEDLILLASKVNRIITVFQNRRWDGDFLTVKKIVNEKRLGTIVEAEIHYDRFRNYIEENTWKEERGAGTGILYNLGSHMLDQAVMLFGMPLEVDARIGAHRPGSRVDDYYDIRLTYTDKLVIVKSSYLVKEAGPRYIIHGTKGSFVKYGLDPQEQSLKDGFIPGENNWGHEDKKWWGKINLEGNDSLNNKVETLPGNYLGFYQNVYEVIREGKPLAVNPAEAMNVIRLIELSYESNKMRRAIPIH